MAGRSALGCVSACLRRRAPRQFHPAAGARQQQELVDRFRQFFSFEDSGPALGFRRNAFETGACGSAPGVSPAGFQREYRSVPNCRLGNSAVVARNSSLAEPYSTEALEIENDAVRPSSEIGYEVLGQFSPTKQRIRPRKAFAVIQVGSHQFKVTPGDLIYTEKLKDAAINEKLLLNKVLLMGSLKQTIIGRPIIPTASVLAVVEEHALDAKVIVFKKKRRKNYRRTRGHRQELTRLRILEIEGIDGDGAAVPSGDNNQSLEEGTV